MSSVGTYGCSLPVGRCGPHGRIPRYFGFTGLLILKYIPVLLQLDIHPCPAMMERATGREMTTTTPNVRRNVPRSFEHVQHACRAKRDART